jgi:hypothetical protein
MWLGQKRSLLLVGKTCDNLKYREEKMRITLRWILKKSVVRIGVGWNLLRIRGSGIKP